MQAPAPGERRWLPLESNPDVVTDFAVRMGMPPEYQFHDVFGTDPELLAFVPTPVLAVMLLFPVTEISQAAAASAIAAAKESGETVSSKVWFCKQKIENACGTIALLHALANLQERIPLSGWAKDFCEKTQTLDPDARAEVLDGDRELDKCHAAAAELGQTRPPDLDEDGEMYELDGRKPFPLRVGKSGGGSLLQDAVSHIKARYIDADPAQLNFNILALGPSLLP